MISVDTKKKELVGNFKNGGREYHLKGNPLKVLVHDFKIEGLRKVNPYGIYDISRNEGWVSVGTDHDTSAFAVESIRQWWNTMGKMCPETFDFIIYNLNSDYVGNMFSPSLASISLIFLGISIILPRSPKSI